MASGPLRVTERHRELAQAARRKREAGKQPNKQEAAALERVTTAAELKLFLAHAERVPKWLWSKWSNRQHKTIAEMAERYGMPAIGDEVSLPQFVRWVYGFLAANSRKLLATDAEDPMSGELSPALERWREEKYRLARLDRQERESTYLHVDTVHAGLSLMSGILRKLGESMQRHHGAEAHQLVDEAVDDWERELDRLFGDHDNSDGDEPA